VGVPLAVTSVTSTRDVRCWRRLHVIGGYEAFASSVSMLVACGVHGCGEGELHGAGEF
jgi:hypothetical protein